MRLPEISSEDKQNAKQNAIEKKSGLNVEICRLTNSCSQINSNLIINLIINLSPELVKTLEFTSKKEKMLSVYYSVILSVGLAIRLLIKVMNGFLQKKFEELVEGHVPKTIN